MSRGNVGCALIVAAFAAFMPGVSRGVVLYSNLTPNAALSGDQSVHGSAGAVMDDILIDNTINNPTNLAYAQISSVIVGLVRSPGAGPVTVGAFYGTTTTPLSATAFPVLDNPVSALGSV